MKARMVALCIALMLFGAVVTVLAYSDGHFVAVFLNVVLLGFNAYQFWRWVRS